MVEDSNHNIVTNTPLKIATISTLSSLLFCFQTFSLSKPQDRSKLEPIVHFKRLKQ